MNLPRSVSPKTKYLVLYIGLKKAFEWVEKRDVAAIIEKSKLKDCGYSIKILEVEAVNFFYDPLMTKFVNRSLKKKVMA